MPTVSSVGSCQRCSGMWLCGIVGDEGDDHRLVVARFPPTGGNRPTTGED